MRDGSGQVMTEEDTNVATVVVVLAPNANRTDDGEEEAEKRQRGGTGFALDVRGLEKPLPVMVSNRFWLNVVLAMIG